MVTTDPRVDAYIDKAAAFAQPILRHLRTLVHRALPNCEEAIKWGMPHFTLGGKNVAGIAAFKAHCAFVVHGEGRQGDAMGNCGKIKSLDDIPSEEELTASLQAAAARIASEGTAIRRSAKREPKPAIAVPGDFSEALARVPAAQKVFAGLPPGARREYLEWIVGAKREETRANRIAQAVEWIAEGKRRNWKYEKC